MPFLLLDDAVDDATRRLQDFGSQQLQDLTAGAQGAGEALGQAAGQVGSGLQDITARLQDFGQQQVQNAVQTLQPLQQQAQAQQQDAQQALTRLHDFGQQQVTNLTQQAAQPSGGQFDQFGDQSTMAVGASQQQAVQPGGDLRAYARQAAQQAGIDLDIFVNQIQQESGFNPSAKSPVGAIGIAQFMPGTAQGMGIDPTDPYAALDAAAKMDAQNLQKYGGDWRKVLAAYNAGPNAVDQYGGVPPYKETQDYVSTILGGAKNAVQNVAQGAQQAVSNALPTLSQFGDKQLSAAEAYAACGPAAAVRFAQMFGRQPTLREAVDLASQVGWTPQGGMAGLGSESALFDKMGIPHREVGANWDALAREASSGNPVTISTPGHYFTADGYDANTGAFHVGSSGTDLRGGSEWMTPQQMEARMGALQGGLAVDNPQVPSASPLASPVDAARQGLGNLVQGATDKAQSAWQLLQQAPEASAGFVSPLTNLNDPATQAFIQAHPEEMKYLGIGQPTQELSVTDPHLISALGVDPLGALQRGGRDIVGALQTGDIGRGLGGAFEAGTGLLSALPGEGVIGQGPTLASKGAGQLLSGALGLVDVISPPEVAYASTRAPG